MWVTFTQALKKQWKRNFKRKTKLFCKGKWAEDICKQNSWKFTSLATFSVAGGGAVRWKSSWYSKSFSSEWNWNSTVIVTSPRIGNSLESNYKFLPQRQRMLQNFASDFAPIFGGKLAQSDDTSFSLCLGRQAAHKRRELDRAEGAFPALTSSFLDCRWANQRQFIIHDLSIYRRYIGPVRYWSSAGTAW